MSVFRCDLSGHYYPQATHTCLRSRAPQETRPLRDKYLKLASVLILTNRNEDAHFMDKSSANTTRLRL